MDIKDIQNMQYDIATLKNKLEMAECSISILKSQVELLSAQILENNTQMKYIQTGFSIMPEMVTKAMGSVWKKI